jgi:hypothetical protein
LESSAPFSVGPRHGVSAEEIPGYSIENSIPYEQSRVSGGKAAVPYCFSKKRQNLNGFAFFFSDE